MAGEAAGSLPQPNACVDEDDKALDVFAESVFFSGIGNEQELRIGLDGMIAILRDAGRLAEVETLRTVRRLVGE